MGLSDDLVDATTRILGFRTAEESARGWPSIIKALGRVRDRLGAMKPRLRRNPDVDQVADWLFRTLYDAPVAEELRAQALEVLGRVKAMVGASTPDWRPAPARRRSSARP